MGGQEAGGCTTLKEHFSLRSNVVKHQMYNYYFNDSHMNKKKKGELKYKVDKTWLSVTVPQVSIVRMFIGR